MAYALSPGVTVIEKDFTSIVPSVSSSMGAFAGAFQPGNPLCLYQGHWQLLPMWIPQRF